MSVVTREAVLAAARRALRPGISEHAAVAIGYAEVAGQPLDPYSFDDSAIILRAERLLRDGLSAAEAVETARAEFITWNVSAGRTT